MQYKTTCNNCGREYMVNGKPGQTIHAKCPFCGALANVVTPTNGLDKSTQPYFSEGVGDERPNNPFHRKRLKKPLFLRVTIWFLIAITILLILLTILYLIFTGMSK